MAGRQVPRGSSDVPERGDNPKMESIRASLLIGRTKYQLNIFHGSVLSSRFLVVPVTMKYFVVRLATSSDVSLSAA